MKICKKCNEPKFEIQMKKYKYALRDFRSINFSDPTGICKKCFDDLVFELTKRIVKEGHEKISEFLSKFK